jgi:hypothetical protein
MRLPPLGWGGLILGWDPGVSQTRPPGYFLSTLRVEQLRRSILEKERRIAEILGNVKGLLARTK